MPLRDDLHTWLSAQSLWQQDLAKRLISRPQLEGGDYDEALRVVKSAFGALTEEETAPEPELLALDDLPDAATTGAPRLVSFGRLQRVGAVSTEHELRFDPQGLTVVYGQNAVGKTTYVRALKRVCRAVDLDDEVRANVFAPPTTTGSPTANVELVVGNQNRAQQIDLSNPTDIGLGAISVFDAQCAELYLDTQNAVAFVPSALRVLARLAATQDRMRGTLHAEADTLSGQAPSFPEFHADTAAKRFLTGLSASTRVEVGQELAALDEAEGARLAELRAVVASMGTGSARADAEAAREDGRQAEALAQGLRTLRARVAEPVREELRGTAQAAVTAQEAVELAAREFSNLPVAGIGGSPWRALWQAAREFSNAVDTGFPPESGEHCPLCLQEVAPEATARMAHFEEHVRSSVQGDATRAQAALASALEPLDLRQVEACRTPFLVGLGEREPALHHALEGFLDAVGAQMELLRADPAEAQVFPVTDEPVQRLATWGHGRGIHADTLLVAEDPERAGQVRAELAELDSREKLALRLPTVAERVGVLRRVAALRRAHSALATNRITTKQRELNEEAVTGALEAKLKDELDSLDCGHLPIDLHPQTRVGETQVALRLAGAHGAPRVSAVASEGEQRALSLSFFLAEIATSESDGGIVVDDPVSSLDDERRDYIAKRLVVEAGTRQVVVFTHDLPFMLDLLDQAKDAGLEPLVQGVWRMGDEVGRVDDHPPFKAMKLRERIGVLDQEVAHWDNQPVPRDFDEAWRRVSDFYARLRIAWERAVEERLFKGVVQRFQREVKTQALGDVIVTPQIVNLVDEGMTRCSMFVHDEPPATSTSLPGRTRLAEDLHKLRELVELTR